MFVNNWRAAATPYSALCPAAPRWRKARRDPREQLITHLAIGIEPLLAVAFDRGRIRRRPVFDRSGDAMRELERLVVRLGRECHDQVEIEPVLQILELL